jgi:voltage-gated potassium channel
MTRARPMTSLLLWHFAGRIVPWIVALGAYLFVATLVVRWDMARLGEVRADFGADLYAMYMQIFFEPTAPFPHSPIARSVFWITPLLGAALLARGIFRVGSSLFDIEERRKLWVKIMTDEMKDHIVVCGLGHVGLRVVESLVALKKSVVAIEKHRTESFAGIAEGLSVPVLYGDGRRDELLIEAGVRRARAIVCATNDDLANLEVAIDAKRENPSIRVVMRMFDRRMAEKMRTALSVDETFSTSALSGPLVALQATEPGVLAVYPLEDGSMRVAMQVPAPAGWVGKSVAACEDAIDGRVVGVREKGRALGRARHDTIIAEGDIVTLDLPASSVPRVRSR